MNLSNRIRIKLIIFAVISNSLIFFIVNQCQFRYAVAIISLLQIVITVFIIFLITHSLSVFEKVLANFSSSNEKKTFEKKIEKFFYIDKIQGLIDSYISQKTKADTVKVYDKQTEINVLQSQINPHFLYNTLESIRGQALIDNNVEIAKMVEALAMFFRYSISGKGNLVPLRDELSNIDNYMTIQRYRFNNKFSLEIIIDEEDEIAYDYFVPRLIIQPIVENAIFHGLEDIIDEGKIIIEIILTDKNIIITISDNGKGMTKSVLESLNTAIHSCISPKDDNFDAHGNVGIALPNIHKRIQLLFGNEYGVNIYSTLGQGTDVEITIPIKNIN